jgi:hypothetical protein
MGRQQGALDEAVMTEVAPFFDGAGTPKRGLHRARLPHVFIGFPPYGGIHSE